MSKLAAIQPPSYGIPAMPEAIPSSVYAGRLDDLESRMRELGLDGMVVYADREHCANLLFLTGVDPRFEEALLVVVSDGRRTLLLGNECMPLAPSQELRISVELFQDFSPAGQPRGSTRPLSTILTDAGIERGMRIGCAGWKSPDPTLVDFSATPIELPAYLVDALSALVGDRDLVADANYVFLDSDTGLRVAIEPAEVARFEYAASVVATGIKMAFDGLQPGMRELDVERSFVPNGLPLSCHSMVSFGDKARRALSSPSANRVQKGDPFHLAFGVRGALSCRAGMAIESLDDLDRPTAEFYDEFSRNYWETIRTWYESVRVGVGSGTVFDVVNRSRSDDLFGFALNPGHFLHYEEWSSSPFSENGSHTLRSGTLLQADIIPVSRGPFVLANAEDGVVIGDAEFRDEVAGLYPELWQRIQARVTFLRDVVGLTVDESVMPLSDLCGWFAPYGLNSGVAFVAR